MLVYDYGERVDLYRQTPGVAGQDVYGHREDFRRRGVGQRVLQEIPALVAGDLVGINDRPVNVCDIGVPEEGTGGKGMLEAILAVWGALAVLGLIYLWDRRRQRREKHAH